MIKILVKFPRILLFMLTTILKLCRSILFQMWLNNGARNFVASLSRQVFHPFQDWIKAHIGTKRVIVGCIVILSLIFWWPFGRTQSSNLLSPQKWLSATQRPLGAAEICIDSKLERFRRRAEGFDVMINHLPILANEKPYLPFIGNGYIGVVLSSQSPLRLRQGRALSVPLHFYPVVEVSLEQRREAAAFAVDLVQGVVHRIQCFNTGDACVVVEIVAYAHRRRPNFLVQELRIHNPLEEKVLVELRQVGVSEWPGAVTHLRKINSGRAEEVEYTVTEGFVKIESGSGNISVVVASLKLPDTVEIKGSSTWNFNMVTAVRYGTPEIGHPMPSLNVLRNQVNDDFADAMNIEPKMLRREHSNIWTALVVPLLSTTPGFGDRLFFRENPKPWNSLPPHVTMSTLRDQLVKNLKMHLWSSGFGISYSLASGALNGDKINLTMYYVLSNVPSPLFELNHRQSEVAQLEQSLYYPDHCYEGHHTLQNVKMWKDIADTDDLIVSVNTWLITLEKQGCGKMLKAGADGVLQAMILSYGAFRFTNNHLEFGTHPSDLHRDYFFRRINYGNDTHVNVSVKVGEDNRAVLYVSLDRSNRPYYACDAGCVDSPSKLSREVLTFPVKLTDPLTSILYITSDKEHMEELKHAIHVKEIAEAPAHEHHVMVLHKHGHNWGGLPMLFWGTIAALILVFHLFLFKLVYNEYCSGVEPKYPKHSRGRYV